MTWTSWPPLCGRRVRGAEFAGRAADQPVHAAGRASPAGLYRQEGSCGDPGSAAEEEGQFLDAFSSYAWQPAGRESCTEGKCVVHRDDTCESRCQWALQLCDEPHWLSICNRSRNGRCIL